MAALRNDKLKNTHWTTIKKLVGNNFDITNTEFTFNSFMDSKAIKCKSEIVNISIQATEEDLIEKKLSSLDNQWKSCKFILIQCKVKGRYILKNADYILDLIEESIADIEVMILNKYSVSLIEKIEMQKKSLISLQWIMKELIIFQSHYIYVNEVFAINDIRKELF